MRVKPKKSLVIVFLTFIIIIGSFLSLNLLVSKEVYAASDMPDEDTTARAEQFNFPDADEATFGQHIKNILTSYGLLLISAEALDKTLPLSPFSWQRADTLYTCINQANAFILSLINIFYVVILMVIALATIFDIKSYNASALLPKLVIAILLSNFGLFFVVALTNAAQFLQNGLLGGDGASGLAKQILNSISTWETAKIAATKALGWLLAYFTSGVTVPIQFLYEATVSANWFAVAFMITTVVLWLRIAGLWVLAIFAPFGVALGVLPSTQPLAKQYWRKVVSYAFIGPMMVFFVKLAVVFFKCFGDASNIEGSSTIASITWDSYLRDLGTVLILFVGIVMTKKMGVEVANWSIGAFNKAFKAAFFATTLVAGAGFAIATKGVGPNSIANWLGKRGVSENWQKNIGLGLGHVASRLKGSKIPFVGEAARLVEKPAAEMAKEQVKPRVALGYRNRQIKNDVNRLIADGDMVDLAKGDLGAYMDTLGSAPTQRRREALAALLINEGKVTERGSVDDRGRATTISRQDLLRAARIDPNSSLAQIMQGEIAEFDPRAHRNVVNAAAPDRRRALQEVIRSNIHNAHNYVDDVFRDANVMESIESIFEAGVKPARGFGRAMPVRLTRDDFFKKFDINKKRAAGYGLGIIAGAAERRGDTEALQRYGSKAAKLGADPLEIFDQNAARYTPGTAEHTTLVNNIQTANPTMNIPQINTLITTMRRAAAAMERASVRDPKYYENQRAGTQRDMYLRLDNPELSGKVMQVLQKGVISALRNIARNDLENPHNFGTAGHFANEAMANSTVGHIMTTLREAHP